MNTNSLASVPDTNALGSVTNGLNDIRGIKAPLEIPSAWTWVWWTLAILAVAAVAWWAWQRWRKKKETTALAPVIPPDERARERLREALALIDQPRPFCISVSDTIRLYLEDRFNLHAPDRTTEEFLDELQTSAVLTLDQKQTLGEFLMRCDLVKFARYEPAEPELRGLYDAAVRLIDETEPPPPLPEGLPNAGRETSTKAL